MHRFPLVILLDDLQSPDTGSLEILEMLLISKQDYLPLMVIGCYRTNEVDSMHLLFPTMRELRATSQCGVRSPPPTHDRNYTLES
jgi:predicted ATPase